MGSRGPAKKPVLQKLAEGNRGHQKLPAVLPKFAPPVQVRCPDELDQQARTIFDHLIPQLKANGFLNDANILDVAGGCQWMSVHLQAIAEMKVKGFLALSHKSPALRAFQISTRELRLFLREYGLTPASMGDVEPRLSDKDDPLEDL